MYGKDCDGVFSHSVAISADEFNNLSDAGISLITLLGIQIARYGRGTIHPFGYGRFEWIMGIFTSLAVVFMGIKLVHTSAQAIVNPVKPLFSEAVVIVLVLSIAVKGYLYLYNKKFNPAELQRCEEEICKEITDEIEAENPEYHTVIKGILRRERFSLRR